MKRSAFHRVSIGMTAEAVRRLIGPPRRIVHQADGQHWLYPEEHLELVLGGATAPVVCRVIRRYPNAGQTLPRGERRNSLRRDRSSNSL